MRVRTVEFFLKLFQAHSNINLKSFRNSVLNSQTVKVKVRRFLILLYIHGLGTYVICNLKREFHLTVSQKQQSVGKNTTQQKQ